MLGVVLIGGPCAREVELAARERGLLVNATVPGVVRLVPALVLTEADADLALDRLGAALAAVAPYQPSSDVPPAAPAQVRS